MSQKKQVRSITQSKSWQKTGSVKKKFLTIDEMGKVLKCVDGAFIEDYLLVFKVLLRAVY